MNRIVQDAHTCFGKPRLEGTRMPTIALWHCHEEGISIEEMIGPAKQKSAPSPSGPEARGVER